MTDFGLMAVSVLQATQLTALPKIPIARPAVQLAQSAPLAAPREPAAHVTPKLTDDAAANSEGEMSQVTSVSQLTDVKPTDWAFQALQSLVERYGCIAGYPDQTFRGNRALTRSEFAAGLTACLDRVNELLATRNVLKKDDLIILQKLQEEFAAELANLRGRINSLEARSATLERQQFSTTTRLFGQAIFSLQGSNRTQVDLFPKDGQPERSGKAQTTFANQLELSFATSFRPGDLLLTGFQTGNLRSTAPDLFTNMGRLAYESEQANQLVLSDLAYRFPVTPNFGVIVGPAGVNPSNTLRGINPLEGSGDGALSLLGQRNPILAIGNGTGGVGFDWQIAPRVSLQGIYSAELPALATDSNRGGLVGGRYVAGGQLALAPTDRLDVGLTYLFSRSPDGTLGTGIGDTQLVSPFVVGAVPMNTHAIGATVAWRVNSRWTVGSWGGWTRSTPIGTGITGSVQTTNWMVFSAFPDLFGNGNLGGILVGQPPKITASSLPQGLNFPKFATDGAAGGQSDTAIHLELFYRLRLNDNIAVTPGFVAVFNPNHNAANDTLVIGTLRTTFRF
jgi:Carbohydrate-selective porin, OprB family/S-layer homology domain